MAWSFSDSFDCYAAIGDALNGYWDSGTTAATVFAAGRFAGSQAINFASSGNFIVKSSGVNDAVHHMVVAFRQTGTVTGSTLSSYLELFDATTAQCSVVFRSDGAILLTSGGPAGTVLTTYTGAFPASNTWYAFEIEVFISNTAGYMNVRKNGNPVNDFTSATNLDTQNSANAYANKLQVGMNTTYTQTFDDLYWRSDASSVAWLGDIKCVARAPASDASVQFSRTPTNNVQTNGAILTTTALTNGVAKYSSFTAAYDGTIGTVTVSLGAGYTGNLKCSMFASSGSAPTLVLGSATTVTNPATGSNTFTFGTPVTVAKGTQYWIGFDSDTTSGTYNIITGSTGIQTTTAYASFPVASPGSPSGIGAPVISVTIATSGNFTVVNEAQQDATSSYVYDSVPGHADFYTIAPIASTPLTTFAVTTRAYMIKSDAGTRTAAVQLKSGSSTVASPTVVLTPSNWQWAWRHDTLDPATGAAWTAAAVNVAQVGPVVIA
jgi:hypothetical protein